MRYLLDTCVISEAIRRKPEPRVVRWVEARDEGDLYLSVLSLGELQKGIAKLEDATRRAALQAWLEGDLLRRFAGRILDVDREVAQRWGALAASAERRGRPVPVTDGLLAATALVHGMAVATRNVRDLEPTGIPLADPWAG